MGPHAVVAGVCACVKCVGVTAGESGRATEQCMHHTANQEIIRSNPLRDATTSRVEPPHALRFAKELPSIESNATTVQRHGASGQVVRSQCRSVLCMVGVCINSWQYWQSSVLQVTTQACAAMCFHNYLDYTATSCTRTFVTPVLTTL